MQLRNAMATRQTTAPLLRGFCAREKKNGSEFDLLSEVIFKDLAVPAVTVKLMLGSWFVLASSCCGHVLLILGSGGKLCSPSGSQTSPTLLDTTLPATWLGSRTFCIHILVYMHQSIVHDYSLHSSQFCSLLELYILF